MAHLQWREIVIRLLPVGLLVLTVLSMLTVDLQSISIKINKNNVHNFSQTLLKAEHVLDSQVPIEAPRPGYTTKNLKQYATQNLTQIVWPIQATIKYGIANGFIMIVNASSANEANSIFVAASQHRATSNSWNINGALDGYVGELIAEIMEEVHVVEEAQEVITKVMKKCTHDNNPEQNTLQKNATDGRKSVSDWNYKLHWYGPSVHSLVVFSSFRFSQTEFFMVSLLGRSATKPWPQEPQLDSCAWIFWKEMPTNSYLKNGDSSTWSETHVPIIQTGTQSIKVTNELHRTTYDVAVIKCSFEDPAGADARGGNLYIKINNELCPVFHELAEEIDTIQFEGTYKYEFAFCSPPILWDFDVTHFKEWFMYHHFLFRVKKTHYFVYHGVNMRDDMLTMLDPFIRRGLLTLVDIRSPHSNLLSGQYPSHHLTINDCLHRVRYLSKWALFWSFEDYLTISSPHTLSSILNTYKDDSWISLGSVLWSNVYCCSRSNQTGTPQKLWVVEKMCFRMEHPICNDKAGHSTACPGSAGQRKWIANPRLVFAASIHSALDSQSNGVILDTSVARFNVYKGLLNPNWSKENCMSLKSVNDGDEILDGIWWKDLSISNYVEDARFHARSNELFNTSFTDARPLWLKNAVQRDPIS